jgi:hypothetical protein
MVVTVLRVGGSVEEGDQAVRLDSDSSAGRSLSLGSTHATSTGSGEVRPIERGAPKT